MLGLLCLNNKEDLSSALCSQKHPEPPQASRLLIINPAECRPDPRSDRPRILREQILKEENDTINCPFSKKLYASHYSQYHNSIAMEEDRSCKKKKDIILSSSAKKITVYG